MHKLMHRIKLVLIWTVYSHTKVLFNEYIIIVQNKIKLTLLFTVDVRVFSFSIIVSLDYLMKIKDFFNAAPDPSQQASLQSSQKVSEQTQKKKVANQPAPPTPPVTMMTINLHIEKPDIILLEDMDDIDSNCLVLNVKLRSFRISAWWLVC